MAEPEIPTMGFINSILKFSLYRGDSHNIFTYINIIFWRGDSIQPASPYITPPPKARLSYCCRLFLFWGRGGGGRGVGGNSFLRRVLLNLDHLMYIMFWSLMFSFTIFLLLLVLLCTWKQCSFVEHRNYKIVYRRYASLFFLVGVDNEEVS